MIEFALLAPFLALLCLGIADFARAYTISERVHNAAREAAFFASTHPGQLHSSSGDCADPNNADWHGENEGGGQTITLTYSPNVTGCNASAVAAGTTMRVTASTTMSLLTPLVGAIVGNPLKLSSSVCISTTGSPTTATCP